MRILLALCCAWAAAAAPLKVAVAGMSHSHAGSHIQEMLKSGAVTLVGVADELPEFTARARKLGVPEALIFTDYRVMIERAKPDFVWAFTETNRHAEVVEYCAPRKVHVMVEKPLAATFAEAQAISRAARKYGIQVFTNYGTAWQASYYTAKAALDDGKVGAAYRLRMAIGHMGPGDPRKSTFAAWLADPIKNGGGALMDFGCYGVMLSVWLKGRPASVYATANHLRPEEFPKVEDNATIILNYPDGVSILEGSWNLPARPESGFEIFGRTGSLNVMGGRAELRVNGTKDVANLTVQPLTAPRTSPLEYMAECIRAGMAPKGMVALDLNVAVNEVLDAAKESIRSGRAVKLPSAPPLVHK